MFSMCSQAFYVQVVLLNNCFFYTSLKIKVSSLQTSAHRQEFISVRIHCSWKVREMCYYANGHRFSHFSSDSATRWDGRAEHKNKNSRRADIQEMYQCLSHLVLCSKEEERECATGLLGAMSWWNTLFTASSRCWHLNCHGLSNMNGQQWWMMVTRYFVIDYMLWHECGCFL